MFDLGKKCNWRAFNFGGFFQIELPFLSKVRAIFRHWNYYSKCREQIKNYQTIIGIIFWNFTTFWKSLDSQQLKRWLVSTLKNIVCVCVWPHELPMALKRRTLGN